MFWIILLVDVCVGALGFLFVAAGYMSDAPAEGEATAKRGAITMVVCLIVMVLAIIAKCNGWLPT